MECFPVPRLRNYEEREERTSLWCFLSSTRVDKPPYAAQSEIGWSVDAPADGFPPSSTSRSRVEGCFGSLFEQPIAYLTKVVLTVMQHIAHAVPVLQHSVASAVTLTAFGKGDADGVWQWEVKAGICGRNEQTNQHGMEWGLRPIRAAFALPSSDGSGGTPRQAVSHGCGSNAGKIK